MGRGVGRDAMAINKLKHTQVKAAKETGRVSDGGGLYLQISKTGTKSWLFRFKLHGKTHEMGLGSFNDYDLTEARDKRDAARKLVKEGINPIKQRDKERREAQAKEQSSKTFKECAEEYLETQKSEWKSTVHYNQWNNTLRDYAYPIFGEWPVDHVNLEAVKQVLNPIWHTKTETADRLRGRIERILDWARIEGYRTGENPARWRGHLKIIFPTPSKIKRVKHHPYLPYKHIGSFMKAIRQRTSNSARAVEFLILCGSRTQEIRLATWDEINLDEKTWTIPAERMKGGIEHIVPLGKHCLDLLGNLSKIKGEKFIFPSTRSKKPLADMTLLKLSKSIAKDIYNGPITNHGFRTTFRTWVAEQTNFTSEAAEFCIAHKLKDKTEAAYQRSNLLDKRRIIMTAWANYCNDIKADNVLEFKG